MRRLWAFLLLAVSFAGGYFYHNTGEPYKLDYHKAVINLPITFTKYLNNNKYALGEKYLAEDLAEELKKQGIDTRLYAFEDTFSNRNFNEGFEIYMRAGPELRLDGYHRYADRDRISVLFETIPYKMQEVKNADIVFTGSLKKNQEYRKEGINSYFLPQFTRLDKFYHAPREDLKKKVLFVANQWPKEFPLRKSVEYAKKTGISLEVYGDNWANILLGEYAEWWKDRQIPNDQLKYFYSSADIVLNDTRPDMIETGVISNRIFDATACKAFVISDYMPEIEELYGDAIPMYRNEQEFKQLIEYYLAHPEERRKKAEQAYKITKEKFASELVIGKMVKILRDFAERLPERK